MVPDYYAMLGIRPDADRRAIESALARCQPIWSSGTRNPKTKHTYQSYLDQIPALRRALLGDPSARASYDAELSASRRAERSARLDELQRLVALRAAKGGLTVSDRALLRGEMTRLELEPDDLDRLVEAIPPLPEAPEEEEPSEPAGDVIDPTMRRQIRVTLNHLRRRDLYHVLDLPRDAPPSEVQARADAERRRWMQKARVTAEKTAWLEAITYAQSHLGNPSARARYDRTLVVEAEDDFRASAGFAIRGLRQLDAGTRGVLLREAAARGIVPDRAERLIRRCCREEGVALVGLGDGDGDGPIRILRCRMCGGVHAVSGGSDATNPEDCGHCHAPLRWDCPSCRRGHWVDEPRCSCGFPIEHLEEVSRHLDAAQEALRSRDYDGASAELRQVLGLAPRHAGAQRGLAKIRERMADIQRTRAEFEVARSGGRIVAARAALDAWARLVDPMDPEIATARAEVARRLRDASAHAARAATLATTRPSEARSLYRQALGLASDLPEALDGLRRCPPDPPGDLRADDMVLPVRLRWSSSPPDGLGPVTYRVLRKAGSAPAHPGDGVLVAEVDATECLDRDATPGETYGYAVYGRRGGIDSSTGIALAPRVVLAEVRDLRVEAHRGEVLLSWTPPAGAVGVRVVRKLGAPPLRADHGEPVESLPDRAIDRGLDEDRVVHYGVYALFRTPDGGIVTSPGLTAAALPHAPGEVVEGLTPTPEADGRLRLSWRPPAHGQVMVLRTARPLPQPSGTRLERSRAGDLGGQWLDAAAPGHAFDPHPPTAGICHYTPMTSWAGTLTVGRGIAFSSIPDPSALRAVRISGTPRVHLRWRWSPQGTATIIAARVGAFPRGPDDPEAERVRVTEAEYARLGYHALSLPAVEQGAWHLALYAVSSLEGATIVSPGLDPSSRTVVPGPHPEVAVSYALRPPRFPGRPWSVTFRTEPPGQPIPPMALVVHPRTLPLSVEDGEVVDQFPASRDGATFRIRSRVPLGRNRARVFADPRANPSELPPIRLRHPEAGGTRV